MNTFTQTQVARYHTLTQELIDLVPQIADAEEELTQRKLAAADERRLMDAIGDALVDEAIVNAGGIKEFGSSEDVRKKNAARVKALDKRYIQQEALVDVCEIDVRRQTDLLSDLDRRYSATCHQVVHHAALLQFLAAAGPVAAAPVASNGYSADVQFAGPTPNGFVSGGQAVSPADAAEIGL